MAIDSVDAKRKRVKTHSGEDFAFDSLLLATGARARSMDCPGRELRDVFYLRSLEDSRNLRASAATARAAVVMGGGFIGMEVAAGVAQKNIQTTMIIREDRVWSRFFTPEMSTFFERYYSTHGVRLVKQASIAALEGREWSLPCYWLMDAGSQAIWLLPASAQSPTQTFWQRAACFCPELR